MEKTIPEIKKAYGSWLANPYTKYPMQKIHELVELVLAQQQDIKQLKAELEELKRKG